MMNVLLGNWDNRFYIGTKHWHINFDKYNQELFHLIKNNNNGDFFLTTGPGGFIGTRSTTAFLLGFTLYSNKSIYGFNLLLDILPHLYESNRRAQNQQIVYIYQDLNRFFYKADLNDLTQRKFVLLSPEEAGLVLSSSHIYYVIGNWDQCHYFIPLNFNNIFTAMSSLHQKDKNKYFFNKIDYCNW